VRSLVAVALLACTARVAAPVEPTIPAPQGWVTDTAGVIPDALRARIVALVDELRNKTGAEIAVVTVRTTAPLDDFTYAMRIADAWKPGRRREDTGVVVLVATDDRKLRILVGYGLEGILPDGLVGEIEDREIVPAFRAGRVGDGVWRGVAALATRIARARGVELTGAPAAGPAPVPAPGLPGWVLGAIVLAVLVLMLYQATRPRGLRGQRYYSPFGWGGFGGWDGGGFGGGGGGFGGFGGGSFGGGGAGRSW
jgi:uncharacterized protein